MSPDSKRPRILSGVQPTSALHLGNYLGAIRNWVAEQDRNENFIFIADLHALTVLPEAAKVRERVLELAAIYVAAGMDPARTEIFVQSQIPAHTQLSWILECFTPLGWLERMTQFKSKAGESTRSRERASTGLLTYPCLMAADILLYDADYVPVGADQQQHVELCRDVAQRFNKLRGEVFHIPQPAIRKTGARIMGLDEPTRKMSKSTAETVPNHAILLTDEPDRIRKKIARATTDTEPAVGEAPGPGVANLLEIHAVCRGVDAQTAHRELLGKSYSVLKSTVADSVIEALAPLQQRYHELRADEPALLRILGESAQRVSSIANATLARAQTAVGVR